MSRSLGKRATLIETMAYTRVWARVVPLIFNTFQQAGPNQNGPPSPPFLLIFLPFASGCSRESRISLANHRSVTFARQFDTRMGTVADLGSEVVRDWRSSFKILPVPVGHHIRARPQAPLSTGTVRPVPTDQSESIPHRAAASTDSPTHASRMKFAVGTPGPVRSDFEASGMTRPPTEAAYQPGPCVSSG